MLHDIVYVVLFFRDFAIGYVQKTGHPKNAQFDIYAITSNFFTKFQWNIAKKKI